MRQHFHSLLAIVLVLLLNANAHSAENEQIVMMCDGPYKGVALNGKRELIEVIEKHQEQLVSGNVDEFGPVNLCGAILSGVNFTGHYLDLRFANLRGANLEGAELPFSNLTGALLDGANLKSANLAGVNFKGASLYKANLTDADLFVANLNNTNLISANLTNTNFQGADLHNVIFEPRLETIPAISYFGGAQHLWQMRFVTGPQALVSLRKRFREAGLRHHEREVTYAIRHTELAKILLNLPGISPPKSIANTVDAYFKLIFFEFPTQWGMKPGRALIILLALILLFTVFYVIALRMRSEDGIWMDWSDARIRMDLGTDKPMILQLEWKSAVGYGFYFSVLSAFHIGWRDLNVGSWIARIQPREYILRATGWVRTVSGIQSLISVYLIALSVLTYFGRPFG